jgi:hypothetical protein
MERKRFNQKLNQKSSARLWITSAWASGLALLFVPATLAHPRSVIEEFKNNDPSSLRSPTLQGAPRLIPPPVLRSNLSEGHREGERYEVLPRDRMGDALPYSFFL